MREITDKEGWEEAFDHSMKENIVIFKHSNSCGSSIKASREIEKIADQYQGHIYRVVVQKSREISNLIESETGITHESPQLLLIRSKKVVLTAHHYGVSALVVKRMLAS